MDQEIRLEARLGPYRLMLMGMDIRGFWHREDAELAADDLARKRLPASVSYVGKRQWPKRLD